MLIWQALDGHVLHLLLMMSLDYPLAIHHKKRGVHMDGDRRRFFFFFFVFLELWSFRLFLGALSCTFFFWLMMYFFYKLYMLRGDIMFLFLFLVSHCATLAIDLYL